MSDHTEPPHPNCRCTDVGTTPANRKRGALGAVDAFLRDVTRLPDAHLRAAIDGQLDALNCVRRGERAWGSDDEIIDGLEVLAAELRRRTAR